jgi:prolyl oligopeptidase
MATQPRAVLVTAAAIAACLVAGCHQVPEEAEAKSLSYPESRKADTVDDYFGTKVADPYRWMEDLESKELADWVAAQNRVTTALSRVVAVARVLSETHHRAVELPEDRRAGARRRPALLFEEQRAAASGAVVHAREPYCRPRARARIRTRCGRTARRRSRKYKPSPDGKLLVYGMSEGGADWETLRVRDIDAARDLADDIRWMRFSGSPGRATRKAFFYSRYPEPPKGKALEAALTGQTLYYHRVGTPQSADILIYERKDLPTWFIDSRVTEDGRYLLIVLAKGSDNNNRLYFADLGDPQHPTIGGPIKPLVEADDAEFAPFGNNGPVLFLRTDRDAPNRRVIALDVRKPAPSQWKTIVPERQWAIETVGLIGGRIVAQYSSTCRAAWRCSVSTAHPSTRSPFRNRRGDGALRSRDEPDVFTASAHRSTRRRCFAISRP